MNDIVNALDTKLKISGQYEASEKKYLTLKTDEDRVKFTLRLLRVMEMTCSDFPLSLPDRATKSIFFSENLREMGTQFFVTPRTALQLDTAIEFYTKSIVAAPPRSRELALGYANRSAALFKARLYQDCLQDISRALALPYPDNLKAKLYARRARCLMTLKNPTKNQKEEFKDAFKMAAEYLDKMTADNQGRKLVEKVLREPKKMVPVDAEYKKWQSEALMPKLSNENPKIKGVSSALEFAFNEEFGRHVVATRDISPGEVLAITKPYAAVILPEKYFTHCAYCMEQTWSSIPCEGCCEVVYCNEDCKKRAYEEYHDIECQVTGHLFALGMGSIGLVSLRLTVRAIKEAGSIQALREKIKELESQKDPKTVHLTQGLFDDRNYASVYTLVTNTHKKSFPDLLKRSVSSSYILLALATKSDLFGKKFEGRFDELRGDHDVTFVGGLIMRHEQMIMNNGLVIHEAGPSMGSSMKSAVLMPFYSLMNHSCNPNMTKIDYGLNTVAYADYAIKKGEQVFDNYGPHFITKPRQYRRMRLEEQHCFFCNCIACVEDWPENPMDFPSLQDLPSQIQKRLSNVMKNYSKYLNKAMHQNLTGLDEMIADMNNMIKVIQENAPLPCRELIDVIVTKNRILALAGNRLQTVNL